MPTSSDSLYPALILSDGGLESLLAVAITTEDTVRAGRESPGPRPIVLPAAVAACRPGHGGPALTAAAAAHAERFGADARATDALPQVAGPLRPAAADDPLGHAEAITTELLRACFFAARLGCDRVIWPVSAPALRGTPDPAAALADIGRVIDTAVLASRLVGLESEHLVAGELRVETPFADLSPAQLLDLMDDQGLTDADCWFGSKTAALSALAQTEQARWQHAKVPAATS